MSCPNCFSGSAHEGTPKGNTKDLHGRKTYVAEPPHGTDAKGVIVIVPDAFGWEFVNNRLLADHYAEKGGFRVYLPDFMDGRAAPTWMLDVFPGLLRTDSVWSWISKP
jgi:dienelactone hydrolase